ncbi:MAG: DUF4837 family protein [Salinivirgaceae bacterium]
MNLIKLLIVTSLLISLGGCKESRVKESLLPSSSGNPGEVVLIMEKTAWEGSAGESFRNLLQEETPGLPQREPLFNLVNIPAKAFTDLFKIHRNLIVASIDPSIEEAGINVDYNRWSKPQLIITMKAPNRESFLELYDENNQKILGLLLKAERDRLMNNYKTYSEHALINKLEKRAGLHLDIPKGYYYAMDTNNFIWLAHETSETSQGLFIYYYEYVDAETFSLDALINKRNEMLKKYVGGENPGSYMSTELQVLPNFRSFKLNGTYTAELRGLWKVEGDFMGGPFISISQLDESKNRVVTVEGFVYAPKYNKRNYVRQLEAILYSLKLNVPEQKKTQHAETDAN